MSRNLPSKKFKLPVHSDSMSNGKRLLLIIGCGLLLAVTAVSTAYILRILNPVPEPVVTNTSTTVPAPNSANQDTASNASAALQLDPKKNYGNKYADGNLPVGDGKSVTTAAKKGFIYTCAPYEQSFAAHTTPATTRGPWFVDNNSRYKVTDKEMVKGDAAVGRGIFSNSITGSKRTIISNNLPMAHTTGTFPIARTDPAYAYDRNVTKITAKSYTYSLPAIPTYGAPQCINSEQVGVMLSGVALYNGFDPGGRDAGAWEIFDECEGHPGPNGDYHYHKLSTCIGNTSAQTVIGFALDGFPITGSQIAPDNILTSNDLDECHGITSQIILDGRPVTTYHYVLTQDFPYSVSCYRAKPITPPSQATPNS